MDVYNKQPSVFLPFLSAAERKCETRSSPISATKGYSKRLCCYRSPPCMFIYVYSQFIAGQVLWQFCLWKHTHFSFVCTHQLDLWRPEWLGTVILLHVLYFQTLSNWRNLNTRCILGNDKLVVVHTKILLFM